MEIKLTRGYVALIDDEDFEKISKHKWYCNSNKGKNYAVTNIGKGPNRSSLRMHRVIMDAEKGQEIDHINGSGLDNRRCNLRFATRSQNCMNAIRPKKRDYKGRRGVYYRKSSGKFLVNISIGGKQFHVGSYATERKAALAYNQAAIKYHKEFAVLNDLVCIIL